MSNAQRNGQCLPNTGWILDQEEELRNGISPAKSINKDVTSSAIPVLQCELVSPEGTQEEYLPNPCPSSRWCHPTISFSVVPFSSHPQSFPASGSFQMSQFFASGGQSIGVSASAPVLPMNTQDWSPLGWTGWISLQSKGLSRVFSNTIVQKHHFFGAQLSLKSNSHIHTWLQEKS